MQLGVKERLVLLSTLPAQGDIHTLRQVRKLRETLEITDDEHKRLEVKRADSLITWNEHAEQGPVEFIVGDLAKAIVVETLKRMDSRKELTVDHISLWEKFCEGG